MKFKLSRGLAFSAIFSLGASAAPAAVVSSNEVNDDPIAYDAAIVPSLITTGQPSLAGPATLSRTPDNGFAAGGVNNGSAVGATGATVNTATLTFFNDLTVPATVTFKLTQPYNITSVRSLAGWNDTYFGSQQFTVALETANSGVYTPLSGVFGTTPYTGTPPAGFPQVADAGFATRTTLTENTTGILGTNVTGVQFAFTDPYPTIPSLNGTVIRELSVFGAPVPEPTSMAGIALAVGCLLRRKRVR